MQRIIITLIGLTLLSGCAFPRISAPTVVPSSLPSPTETFVPTVTIMPSPSAVPTPTLAPPTELPAGPGPTATAVPAVTDSVNSGTVVIFLTLINDKGFQGEAIGCDDSLVLVEMAVPPYTDPVEAALEALFSIQTSDFAGLYNGLHLSKLSFVSISYEGTRAVLRLSGDVLSGGLCDDPRIKMQIRHTVLINKPGLADVTVLVDGRDLEDVLSLQGK